MESKGMVYQTFTLTELFMAIYTGGDRKLLTLDEGLDLPQRSSVVAGWPQNANSASSFVPHPVKGKGHLHQG